jgi:hypothetical protein
MGTTTSYNVNPTQRKMMLAKRHVTGGVQHVCSIELTEHLHGFGQLALRDR